MFQHQVHSLLPRRTPPQMAAEAAYMQELPERSGAGVEPTHRRATPAHRFEEPVELVFEPA